MWHFNSLFLLLSKSSLITALVKFYVFKQTTSILFFVFFKVIMKMKNLIELLTNWMFSGIQFLVNCFNQIRVGKPTEHFESSASVYRIVCRYKTSRQYEFSHKNDFVALFEEFEHPSIVLEERYSLYTVTKDEAIFVDCNATDIFDKDKAFVYDTQFQTASRLITMPISSFHLIAKHITFPDIPVAHLPNHGRCGSTLLTKVFDAVPNSLSISELNSFTELAEISLKNGVRDYEMIKQLLKSVVMMTLKHGISRKSSCVLIKCQSSVLFITEIMIECFPNIKQVYMYRQALGFVQSYEKLEYVNNWDPLTTEMSLYWGGVGNHSLMQAITSSINVEAISELSSFSKWAIIWISSMACYQKLTTSGLEIKSLKFEHMLADPQTVFGKFFAYLGIPLKHMPDLERVLSVDSQANTPFSSRGTDKEKLKMSLTPITQDLKDEIKTLSTMFGVDQFWDDVVLENSF